MSNPLVNQFEELRALPASLADQIGHLLIKPTWMGLALHLPLRYEDRATLTAMDALQVGQQVNLSAWVVAQEVTRSPRKQLKVWVEDGPTQLLLRWVNVYPGQAEKMPPGTRLKITGKVRQGYGLMEIVHPNVKIIPAWQIDTEHANSEQADQAQGSATLEAVVTEAAYPVYPSTGEIKQADWARWIKKLPAACFEDTLQPAALENLHLPSLKSALHTLHGQAQADEVMSLNLRTHAAWQRIKLDELLAQQLQLKWHREQRQQEKAHPLSIQATPLRESFLHHLGFRLTQSQQDAFAEIAADLAQPHPMQRLLQGDVGSGKTVVAALACLVAIENGTQAALLAPTEVLAEQHHYKLHALFEKIGIPCAKLTGAMKKSEKNKVLAGLQDGTIPLVIGTHALVQDTVHFHNLTVVVVDEQHRFGVAQRLSMLSKAQAGLLAHQLMMSATPIPRTLAQTYLSDLAVSNLHEKPPGRKPIVTKLLSQKKREQLIAAIDKELQQGHQVYWVCPLIEESEKLDLQAAEMTQQELQAALPHTAVGLLHGKQDPKHKQAVMKAFTAGEVKLLVSTTVIEVGVDVSNASLMVIDQAERFGLAQLHQLRGRVGRGSIQSVCVLLYGDPLSQTAKRRLKAMHESEDGFHLAEIDLELRGPGELLGKRQSGVPLLRYADPFVDKDWVQVARQLASQWPVDSESAQRHVARWVDDTAWWLS